MNPMGIIRIEQPYGIAPLFEGWEEYVPRATLESGMGEAYANETRTAAQVFIAGFSFLAGDASCEEAALLAHHLPASHTGGEHFIVPHGAAWEAVVEKAWGAQAVRGQRYAIRKDVHHFEDANLLKLANTLPEGYALAPIDGALYRAALAQTWSCDLVSQFEDEADYLTRGLGFAALYEGTLVAGASSFVVYRGAIEVEVDTRRDHRRRGLATACAAQLVRTCLARGIYPSWDAHNLTSVGIAQRLGYVAGEPYTTYSVEG